MKTEVWVSFGHGKENYERIKRLLEEIDCTDGFSGPPSALAGYYNRCFDGDDPRLGRLRAALHKAGCTWDELQNKVYTDDELRRFPLLALNQEQVVIDGGGPRFGTEYDVTPGCPNCGTGAVQTSPLFLPPGKLPRRAKMARTNHGDFVVAKDLAQALREAEVSGLELRQVRATRDRRALPWWQMLGSYTMPKLSSRSIGVVHDMRPGWGCPVCNRDCYEGGEEFAYDRAQVDPAALPDFVHSWEHFGRSLLHDDPERGLGRGFALPRMMVKPRVFDVFQELGAKEVGFIPVRIE